MVNVLKFLFPCTCSVIGTEQVQDEKSGRTENLDKVIFENIPCQLCEQSSFAYVKQGNTASSQQSCVLIVENNVVIPEGSRICVKRNSEQVLCKRSGIGRVYESHREYPVTMLDKWI